MDTGFPAFPVVLGFGIMFRWPSQRSESGGCGMYTPSRDFVRSPRCTACSVIRERASSPSNGAQKTLCGGCGQVHWGWYDRRTRRVRDLSSGDARILLELEVRRVACKRCGHVKRERLEFLADNLSYTKRFAYYVGRRCRQATIKDIAEVSAAIWKSSESGGVNVVDLLRRFSSTIST